ncbi:MAG TPA: CHAT domain-containing protein [Crinalium sp.]|jgi:CHAT domain-containing protein
MNFYDRLILIVRVCWQRYRPIFLFCLSLVFSILLHSAWIGIIPGSGLTQTVSTQQLVQQGITQYQNGEFSSAIALWQQSLSQAKSISEQATIHTNLAQAYQQIGQTEQAIAQREQAIQLYPSNLNRDQQRELTALLIEQGQAYGELGQYRRAIPLLESALNQARSQSDSRLEVAALGALGDSYTAQGDYNRALTMYDTSLERAIAVGDAALLSVVQNSRGNFYVKEAERYRFQANAAALEEEQRSSEDLMRRQAEQAMAQAQQAYEQSWQTSQAIGGLTEATALLNLNRLLIQVEPDAQSEEVLANWSRVEQLLTPAPNSRAKAYGLMNLAMQITPVGIQNSAQPQTSDRNWQQSQTLLQQALAVARAISDQRAESFALGMLGRLEEVAGHAEQAMRWTQQAQLVAQQMNALDSLYRWQWQNGRLLKATGQEERARQAYSQAIVTLQSIRGDIVSANQDLQFNFRDSVEPVYREQMELLLASSIAKTPQVVPSGDHSIPTVLKTLDLLKLAELQNFFGDECVQIARDRVEQGTELTDTRAAVLYSLILEKRTELILRSPDATLIHYTVQDQQGNLLSAERLRQEIDVLRRLLEKRTTDEYLDQAQTVYDLLIRPLDSTLAAIKPQTLVLVNDDVLRNVPLAALHDGGRFLAEKYAIATTPSLSLTTGTPMSRNHLSALIVGLIDAPPPFFPLTNVGLETKEVQKLIGGTVLLDKDFTLDNVKAQLERRYYPIVHIATHGRFGVDDNNTFLLAADNQRLSIADIDTLLQTEHRPVELLTLSACQTAAGDNRTALGIAGVAVRSGVKSALATLWYINDEATVPLIESFYQFLRNAQLTKAEALQKAQLAMIHNLDHPEYQHPAVWAAFILVGNWL